MSDYNKGSGKRSIQAWVLLLQLPLTVLATAFIGLFIGNWLDGKLNTRWIGILGLILGILGGAKAAYMLAKSVAGPDKTRKEENYDLMEGFRREKDEDHR